VNKKSLKSEPAIVQEHPEDAPPGWADVQDEVAAALGLSVLLIDGRQPPAIVASNNNSICHAFQSSPEHVGLCDPYCGDAHRKAMSSGGVAQYKCHAGLECFTMPVRISRERNLAAIGGRAFVTSADYRSLMERLINGDLQKLLERDPLGNVIFAELPRLEQLASRLQKAALEFNGNRKASSIPEAQPVTTPVATETTAGPSESLKSSSDLQREIELLRDELDHRSRLAETMRSFLERISSDDPQTTYESILTNSKNLLMAERASLLVVDETGNELILKAGAGLPTSVDEISGIRIGEGISGRVLESGKPLIVESMEIAGLQPAPPEREYRSESFISYPLIVAGRTIGVFNATDKLGGGSYDNVDLSLLEIIGPQVALALERAEWQERAREFQLMSITDPLTGLLNRRYLQERLNEELNRSRRYDYPMSFLMIDIDDFKNYNDMNGHQAGDLALQVTAHCLKAALRSADVACRYGGEEFGILLPQTPLNEAAAIAERMRQRVSNTVYPQGKSQPLGRVTISIGIATFRTHVDTVDRVIGAADRALYNAKSKGKDQIEFYQDS